MDKKENTYRPDELTLREFVQMGNIYFQVIKKRWLFIVGFMILSTAASFLYFKSKPTLYKARLSFMLNEDEGNQMGSLSSVLGDLGLPIMNQRINIAKVLELSLSRKIIQEAIFQRIESSTGSELIANRLLEVYELKDKWTNEDYDFSNFSFNHVNLDSFNRMENVALKRLAVMAAGTPANRGNALIETDYGQNTTIMSFVTRSEDELISYHLTNAVFDATSRFYIEKSREKQQNTFDVLDAKRDSLRKTYNQREYRYADLADKSSGLFSMKGDVKIERARAEMIQMGAALTKLEENIALVEFGLENSTPVLQVIDAPILPLEEEKTGSTKSLLIGLILGFVVSVSLIILSAFLKLMSGNEATY